MLILFVLANLLNYMDRYVIGAIVEPIGQSLQLNDSQLGRLAFVFLLVYLICAPIFGALAERYNRMKLVSLGIVIWSLATCGAAFAWDYSSLLFFRAAVGVGEAAYATLGPAMLTDVYKEEERPRVFTWFFLAIPVGSALGFGLGGVMAGYFGWRSAFLLAGLPGLFLAWKIYQLPEPVRGATEVTKDKNEAFTLAKRIGHILMNRPWIACTLSYVGYTFAMGAYSHWAPAFLHRKFSISIASAGIIFGAVAVVTGIIGTFLGGKFTDKYQLKFPDFGLWISLLTLLVSAPVMWFALESANLNISIAFWALGMFLLFVNTSPVNSLTVSSLSPSQRAMGMAMNIFLIHILGDAISPEIVGRISMHLGSGSETLGKGLLVTLPAIVFSGLALILALGQHSKKKRFEEKSLN
jgi:predicted MFS family arabinose efflux permease